MSPREKLAIVGSGASSIYLLKHLLDGAEELGQQLGEISIFEKSSITGMGMPYNPQTTDRYNMSNISSDELPPLLISFADWLRAQDASVLQELGITDQVISETKIYPRLALGRYLNAQYQALTTQLADVGLTIHEYPNCEITDIQNQPLGEQVILLTAAGASHLFDKVIISTGHTWLEEDEPAAGYFGSPWPIKKLLPAPGTHHDFVVGTLGASLSAFDVIASLAHRHGKFVQHSGGRKYLPHPGTEGFKIVMHASGGLLPHLQFDQQEPYREIYRHVTRDEMLDLIDPRGFLRLETYFDRVCRPVLSRAFAQDELPELVELLADPGFGIAEFAEKMTDEHDYSNPFEGMKLEMVEAKESVHKQRPIHWKESIDDLMYTLNFHAEQMPAEDHLLLRSTFMPFLMNVIAAMPLESGHTLLALYDAGKIEMIAGRVTVSKKEDGITTIVVDDNGKESTHSYRMFVDCSGQKPLELEDYPFPGLVENGTARKARAAFAHLDRTTDSLPEDKKALIFEDKGQTFYHIGGVDIDAAYRLINQNGIPSAKIHDIAFPHTSGIRPYSYGLQACNETTALLVAAWLAEVRRKQSIQATAHSRQANA
jgi:hypothetical protein